MVVLLKRDPIKNQSQIVLRQFQKHFTTGEEYNGRKNGR
jgi:hypothetical protein